MHRILGETVERALGHLSQERAFSENVCVCVNAVQFEFLFLIRLQKPLCSLVTRYPGCTFSTQAFANFSEKLCFCSQGFLGRAVKNKACIRNQISWRVLDCLILSFCDQYNQWDTSRLLWWLQMLAVWTTLYYCSVSCHNFFKRLVTWEFEICPLVPRMQKFKYKLILDVSPKISVSSL